MHSHFFQTIKEQFYHQVKNYKDKNDTDNYNMFHRMQCVAHVYLGNTESRPAEFSYWSLFSSPIQDVIFFSEATLLISLFSVPLQPDPVLCRGCHSEHAAARSWSKSSIIPL